MALPDDFNFEVTIDKTGNAPVIRVKDLTDYGLIPLTDVKVFINIEGPLGVVHLSTPPTPDIDRGVTDTSANYLIPLNTNQEVPQGQYLIDYGVTVESTGDEYTLQKIFDYSYVAPVPKLKITYSCIRSELKSNDDTNYQVEGQDYISTTLKHDITWPVESGEPKEVTTAAEVVLGPNIWTGKYYSSLDTRPKYQIDEGVFVIDKLITGLNAKVICDIDYCKISSSLRNLINQRNCLSNKMSGEYQRLDFVITRATELIALADVAKLCENDVELEKIYKEINALLEGVNCGCSVGATAEPREVEPIVGGGCCPNLYSEW
jgi:hypothetical protein